MTKLIRNILVLGYVSFLLGCGAFVPVKNLNSLSLPVRRDVLSLPIYNESQLKPDEYEVLLVVEGISCKNKMWDHAATKSDAINQAKYWAYEMKADALLNIQCEFPRGTTTTYNCWESITCIAQAIRLKGN